MSQTEHLDDWLGTTACKSSKVYGEPQSSKLNTRGLIRVLLDFCLSQILAEKSVSKRSLDFVSVVAISDYFSFLLAYDLQDLHHIQAIGIFICN